MQHIDETITIRLRGLRSLTTPTVFESLIEFHSSNSRYPSIRGHFDRKKDHQEVRIDDGGWGEDRRTPRSERMSLVSIDDLRGLGLSQHKADRRRHVRHEAVEKFLTSKG